MPLMQFTRTRSFIVFAALCAGVLTVGCPGDDGDSSMTKRQVCYKVVKAYCGRMTSLNCEDASACATTNNAICQEQFSADCKAADEWQDEADHVISMWINTKDTCDSLESVGESLAGMMQEMQQDECVGDSGTHKTQGAVCQEVIQVVCTRILALGCITSTQSECVAQLFASGAIEVGGTACTSASDADIATDNMLNMAETLKQEANDYTDCSDFGF